MIATLHVNICVHIYIYICKMGTLNVFFSITVEQNLCNTVLTNIWKNVLIGLFALLLLNGNICQLCNRFFYFEVLCRNSLRGAWVCLCSFDVFVYDSGIWVRAAWCLTFMRGRAEACINSHECDASQRGWWVDCWMYGTGAWFMVILWWRMNILKHNIM